MEFMKSKVKKYVVHKMSPFGYFLMFLQFYYLYQVFVTNDVGGFSFSAFSIVLILVSMYTVHYFFQVISILFSFNRLAMALAAYIYILLYGLLAAYQFQAGQQLNFSVLADNFSSAFSLEAINVMYESLHHPTLLYIPLFILTFIVFEIWKKSISKGTHTDSLKRKFIVSIAIYLTIIVIPIDSYDPYINFFRSAVNHYVRSGSIKVALKDGEYPFLNDGKRFDHISIPYNKKPNVFLVMVESLNTSSLGKKDNGVYHTPFLNDLRSNSVYVENFYGNSVQTAKGHFSILFGMIPSQQGKVFTRFKDTRIDSIATSMKDNGYDTSLFSAYHNPNFDNTHDFIMARGFGRFQTVDKYLTAEEKARKFKWGTGDVTYYKHFFDYFDEIKKSGKPQFVALKTSVSHFPFKCVHPENRAVYPNPKKLKHNYANAIHMSDKGLELFYNELKTRDMLKDSIVIITSDHSFPMGEHNNYHLEAGYHEESFRIPLFVLWEGKLKPQVIKRAQSQIDIAPTIIDMLSLDVGKNNFLGQSIFAKKKDDPIYLVQSYAKHYEIVDFPLKYRYFEKLGKEYVYDLAKDPMEEDNIISSVSGEKMKYFREHLKKIYLHQLTLKNDRFWPESTTKAQDS